jgi:hypothetical protein
MATSHGTDRVSARRDLGNNPDLVLIAPGPPPSGTGEHFQPPDGLGDSTTFSVHSKPNGQNQTADSQIRTSYGRWAQHTAYERGGQRAFSKALEKLAEDPIRYMRVVGALFPDKAREAVKDAMAELRITDEDLREFLRKLQSPASNQ